jgi:hypothetical protein
LQAISKNVFSTFIRGGAFSWGGGGMKGKIKNRNVQYLKKYFF